MTLTISCKMQKWAINQGWKRSLLKYCSTSMRQQPYPNFQKWCKHKSKQPIWDEKGRALEVCDSILCQCLKYLMATIDSHTMPPSRNARTNFGLEEKSCKIYSSCNWFEIDVKSVNLHWKGKEKRNNNNIRQYEINIITQEWNAPVVGSNYVLLLPPLFPCPFCNDNSVYKKKDW